MDVLDWTSARHFPCSLIRVLNGYQSCNSFLNNKLKAPLRRCQGGETVHRLQLREERLVCCLRLRAAATDLLQSVIFSVTQNSTYLRTQIYYLLLLRTVYLCNYRYNILYITRVSDFLQIFSTIVLYLLIWSEEFCLEAELVDTSSNKLCLDTKLLIMWFT